MSNHNKVAHDETEPEPSASSSMNSQTGLNRRLSLPPREPRSKTRLVVGFIATAVVGIGLGVIIGYFSRGDGGDSPLPTSPGGCNGTCLGPDVPPKIIEDAEEGIMEKILQNIRGDNVRNNLHKYTSYPHMAGTPGDHQLAQEIYNEWTAQGLDHVTMTTYEMLLSYPNKTDPNLIQLLDETDAVQFETQREEKILDADQNHTEVAPPFNAYSPDGDRLGDLVYVNYGRVEDFIELEEHHNINVSGKIVIARYGKIFRGDKVAIAEQRGALAVILYSDPADYSIEESGGVFPDTWWLPGTGAQRGTVNNGDDGDPLTPGYPSTDTAYRRKESESGLPRIPSHPIGYDDAAAFLSRMSGDEVPVEWRGRIANVTYRFGPGFSGSASNWKVRMHVTTRNELANASNVFAYIRGSVEPDRYVMLGNHRDAWVFGAIDPTSSTALIMEVSRVLMNLVKDGWRPRRTIVFCSWGAEEHGLLGSFEYVEEAVKNLISRTVAYLNVDLSVEGQASLRAKAVPILYDLLYDVAKRIPSANNPNRTVFAEWVETFPSPANNSLPRVLPLGSGSDHAAFIGIAGVPCIDVRYTHNYGIIDYPVYHSVYETFNYFDRLLDPQYKYSVAVGQFWAESARYLADSLIIPLNASRYGDMLQVFVRDLHEGYGTNMTNRGNISLDGLDRAADRFQATSVEFMNRIQTATKHNPLEIRMYNDQLMQLERAFTDSAGLPDRPLHKHLLFAPSAFNSYAGDTFPGLVDLMWQIEKRTGEDELNQWERVKQHLSVIIYGINSATAVLKPVISYH